MWDLFAANYFFYCSENMPESEPESGITPELLGIAASSTSSMQADVGDRAEKHVITTVASYKVVQNK